ncbi:protocatechuate 3,4-dioxygenase beta subunit [Trichoderma arundinaceum]|uniref:Protocatechuate 3,4-dioxygenase beta subunit n=1 Tax=Trichoderma arundinaceum TaxID=490622 RepID=A0A395NWV1_TRIAR|nr:protocatechuate 3,4-dioxygenase beta subunit [Trichoderma arundinaceum]
MKISLALFALGASRLIEAHPSSDADRELNADSLGHCTHKLKTRDPNDPVNVRKRELVDKLQKKSGLKKCNSYDQDDFWLSDGPTCIPAPQAAEGPHYDPGGHIREDITEDQQGTILAFGVEFLDVETCEPVTDVFVDVWHANATGSYSGFTNPPSTFLRGLQKTDAHGIAQFLTIFPGHHPNRAPHIHFLVHTPHTTIPDEQDPSASTIVLGNTASHVGQIYFYQDMIHRVQRLSPYRRNEHHLTLNEDDKVLREDLEKGGYPFMDVTELDVDDRGSGSNVSTRGSPYR